MRMILKITGTAVRVFLNFAQWKGSIDRWK